MIVVLWHNYVLGETFLYIGALRKFGNTIYVWCNICKLISEILYNQL